MKDSESRAIDKPGGMIHHQARFEMLPPAVLAAPSMDPQVITVGSPRPRKLNAASVTIAAGTERARLTYVRDTMFGKICRAVMYPVPAPEAFAASMKGLSRRLSTCERMILAKPIQLKNPIRSMI